MNEKLKVLECSSKGDVRFSPLFAKVSVFGIEDTIEKHYQFSKLFLKADGSFYSFSNWKKAKTLKPFAIKIGKYYLPFRFATQFYDLMWYKYLKSNKHLEAVLVKYDDYSDMFKTSYSKQCQADTIRKYMMDEHGIHYTPKERGKALKKSCSELIEILEKKNNIIIEKGDIFETYTNIIGHQVNCKGIMGKGIAKTIKELYPEAYNKYKKVCNIDDPADLLGKCQIVNSGNKLIANLFGQYSWSSNRNIQSTNYDMLYSSLLKLKTYAKDRELIVSLPYGIGANNGGGDWDIITQIITKAFSDYYVILCQLPTT